LWLLLLLLHSGLHGGAYRGLLLLELGCILMGCWIMVTIMAGCITAFTCGWYVCVRY
jgi:hypothetical protein